MPKVIATRAVADYARLTEETVTLVDALSRDLHLVAEVAPQKRSIPFKGGRKDRTAIARMSVDLLDAVDRIAALLGQQAPLTVVPPDTVHVEAEDRLEQGWPLLVPPVLLCPVRVRSPHATLARCAD